MTDIHFTPDDGAKQSPKPRVGYDICVQMPNDDPNTKTYVKIATAETLGIAQEAAHAKAIQGFPVRYSKADRINWWTITPESAIARSEKYHARITATALSDRAVIASSILKTQSRIGSLVNQVRGLIDETTSAATRTALLGSLVELSYAVFMPNGTERMEDVGIAWERNAVDLIAEAAAAWGLELVAVDADADDDLSEDDLLALVEAQLNDDADPIDEALVEHRGVQA